MRPVLEVCVDSTASALAAKRGGADRLDDAQSGIAMAGEGTDRTAGAGIAAAPIRGFLL